MKRFDLRRYTHEKHQVGLFRQNNNDIDGRDKRTWVSKISFEGTGYHHRCIRLYDYRR
jgi:hypothetical protein